MNRLRDSADSLLSPEPTSLQVPGRRLLAGKYVDFRILQGQTPIIVATYEDEDSRHLRIADGGLLDQNAVDAGSLDSCETGPVTDLVVSITNDYDLLAVVWHDEDDDGYGRVRFVDASCRNHVEPIDDVDLSVLTGLTHIEEDWGYATAWTILTREGKLSLVRNDGSVITSPADVSALYRQWSGSFHTIEDGQIVERDHRTLEEIGRSLSGVHELSYFGRAFLYRDDAGLHLHDDAEDYFIGADACLVDLRGGKTGGVIYLRTPCDSPDLHSLEFELGNIYHFVLPHLSGAVLSSRQRYVESADYHFLVMGSLSSEADILYGYPADYDGMVSLNQLEGTNDPLLSTQAEVVEPTVLAEEARLLGNDYVADWDGKSGLHIEEFELDPTPRPVFGYEGLVASGSVPTDHGMVTLRFAHLANGVIDVFSHDPRTGERALILEDAAWVPFNEQKQPSTPGHFLFPWADWGEFVLLDRDGMVGTLHIWDREAATAGGQGLSDALDTNVRLDSFHRLTEDFGVAYLVGNSSDGLRAPGTLGVYLKNEELSLTVHEDVLQVVPLAQPFGLSYLVASGEDAGVWIARGR